MSCDELIAHLADFVDGDLVIECRETVELHIRGCPKCEAYAATYTHTVRVARVLPKSAPLSPAFEARLRKALEPELGDS